MSITFEGLPLNQIRTMQFPPGDGEVTVPHQGWLPIAAEGRPAFSSRHTLVHVTKSIYEQSHRICFKEQQSHGRSVLPRERTETLHLPVTSTEWLPIGPPLLELTYPLALEMVLHSAIVTDFTMERLPDSLSMSVTPFMQPNLSRKFASVLRRNGKTVTRMERCFPGKGQKFLTYRRHERSGAFYRIEEHSPALLSQNAQTPFV